MMSGPGTKLYGAVLSACVLFPFHGCFHKAHHDTDYADNVQKVVASPTLNILKTANYQEFQPQVSQFYGSREYALAWTDGGVITPQATAMMEQFSNAADKGLTPDDYDASLWSARVQKIHEIHDGHDNSQTAQDTIAEFDAALTISTMRYLQDLHTGRINPQQLNFDIDVPAKREAFNMPQFLETQLLSSNDIPSLTTGIEPNNPLYTATEKALPKYMALAKKQQDAGAEPLPDVTKTVTVGGRYPALAQLVDRLQMEQMSAPAAEGNGSATAQPAGPAANTRYTQAVAELVKTYQGQHGLDPDGKLTSATIESLNVPMSERVQQISDSLERWRWLPDAYQQPRVLVNLPEYIVRTYDADHNLVFAMKAIDGKNDGHDTPVFVREMKYLVFRPFWNLPISIVKKDIVRHDRGWMSAHGYEVTDSKGDPVSDWSMNDLEHSRYMVRQKPGPQNSLGLIKFHVPQRVQHLPALHAGDEPLQPDQPRQEPRLRASAGCGENGKLGA